MSLETQAMILRVLQEGVVYRIGGSKPRSAQVRIVAATNRVVKDLIEQDRFREDLFYRIATWTVTLPPLRHRRCDIPNLAVHFLSLQAERHGQRVCGISRKALDVLQAYPWPGNIRQLQKEMARAIAFIPHEGLLDTTRLSSEIVEGADDEPDGALAELLERTERRAILRTLRRFEGDATQAAEVLGLTRSTFYRRLKTLEIDPAELGERDSGFRQ